MNQYLLYSFQLEYCQNISKDNYPISEPGIISLSVCNRETLSPSIDANNIPWDSIPNIFLGSRLIRTITILPVNSSSE